MAGGLNVGKAPKNRAVLPFYGTASIFFLIISFLLLYASNSFISTDEYQAHYFVPHVLSIVHLAALGWGTMVIFGAAYQLLPVICEQNLFSSNFAFVSYCFLAVGISILGYSFWHFQLGFLMITGGSSILIAAILYFINVIKTASIGLHSSIERLFVFSSSIWLVFTLTVGLLLAINLAYPFFTTNHMEILRLHAHAGLAGWFLQLITGISIKLVPMFLLGRSTKIKLVKWAFALQNTGLILFLTDGYFFGITIRSLIYGVIVITGVVLWLLYIRDVFTKRMKKKIDTPMKHTFVSFSGLLISILLIPVIYFSSNLKWVFIYGFILFLGWISAIILGMTFKTLPFIVWNNHYKKLNGKAKIPLPKDLFMPNLLTYQFRIFIFSLPLIAISIILQQQLLFQIGLVGFCTVALLYFINVWKVLTHKTTLLDGNR